MRYSLIAVLGFSLFITSCGATFHFNRNAAESDNANFAGNKFKTGSVIEKGVASWYGSKFHGRLTANGERYDMYALTAAHRTLPFGTILRVKNLDNGKSIRVRVNDRGPFAKDRIIDLSKKAATEIGMIGKGTANVELILLKGEINSERVSNLKVQTFTVQLASFYTKPDAVEFSRKIAGSRVETYNLDSGAVYRVFYGTYTDKSRAKDKQRELQRRGISGYVKQIQNY